jgi:nitroimidazol reductase NimA-like FMN-containing flavoprotein (pyridoxamine 5'-phosphate oxidase superfamily)
MKILNAGPGFSQPMTEDEVIKFLTTGKRNIYLGTIDYKKEPNIHPTWYYFDPDELKFYVETYKFSKKRENMKNNNTIYFCVDKSTKRRSRFYCFDM